MMKTLLLSLIIICTTSFVFGQKSDLSILIKGVESKMRATVVDNYDSTSKDKLPIILLDDKPFSTDSLYKYEIKDISQVIIDLDDSKTTIYGHAGRVGSIKLYSKKYYALKED